MPSPGERYRVLQRKLEAVPAEEEDPILDEMDEVWKLMSDEERRAVFPSYIPKEGELT